MSDMAVTPVGGTAFVRFNGTQYQLRGSMKSSPTQQQNTAGANADGSFYFIQKPRPGKVEMEISDSGGLSVQQIYAMTGVYLTLELINGKVITVQNGVFTGEPDVDHVEGKFPLTCEGIVNEVTA
jgi:hypothetical protein